MKKPRKPPKGDFNSMPHDEIEQVIKVFNDKEAVEKIAEIDKEYPYWDKFRYKAESIKGFNAELLWRFLKIKRQSNFSNILIADGRFGFAFKYVVNQKTLKYLHEFDLNLGGMLEGDSIIPNEDKNKFLISSIMEEAIASSQLEGAVTTREVAKEMLRTQRKPRDASEKMILNNYLTIKKILELKDKELSKELILEIHSLITKDTLENKFNEGRFRDNNDVKVVDHITGEIYYDPPDYKNIEELIEHFCAFANSKNDDRFIHPIIRAIILHFLIGYIHPFVDGNGRTARAIFYWYLITKGYWLIEYLSVSRIIVKSPSQYAQSYLHTEYDENDLTYFINYNLKSMDLALKSLREYIKRKIKERKLSFHLLKNEEINQRQAEILTQLINDSQKTLSIKEISTKFNTVYQTARTDLFGLVKLGYLQDKTMGHKIIFFRSDDFDQKLKRLQLIQ